MWFDDNQMTKNISAVVLVHKPSSGQRMAFPLTACEFLLRCKQEQEQTAEEYPMPPQCPFNNLQIHKNIYYVHVSILDSSECFTQHNIILRAEN